jgi:FAD dependent oxidoreductase TIGR03364
VRDWRGVSTRIVIVGGGVLGSMHAYLAGTAGCDVVLVEREDAARGASIRNFGLIWVSGRRGGDELGLALRARELWFEVGAGVPEVGLRANGSLTIAQTAAEARVLEQVARREDAAERSLSLLDQEAVREVNPAIGGAVVAGLHCSLDAAVEPRRVPDALRTALERDSQRFTYVAGRHVVEIGNGWVRDHRGDLYAGDLVIACVGAAHRGLGGWFPEPGALRRVRLQMLETEPAPYEVLTSVADGDSLRYYPVFDVPALRDLPDPDPLVDEHKIQLLMQQRLDGSLTIGDTHLYDEPFDVATLDAPYDHLCRRAESVLGRSLPPIRRRWAGVYSQASPETLFHYEQLGDRAVVVTGAGGRGMTLSPAIAESVLLRLGVLGSAVPVGVS